MPRDSVNIGCDGITGKTREKKVRTTPKKNSKKLDGNYWRACCLDLLPMLGVDETSGKILDLLTKNSRISNVEVAKEVGISEATVRRKITEMVEMGIIKGFITLVNCEEKKNCIKVFIRLKVDNGKLAEVAPEIAQDRHVVALYRMNGEYNLLCEVMFKSIIDLQEFIDELTKGNGVLDVVFENVVGSYKECIWTGI